MCGASLRAENEAGQANRECLKAAADRGFALVVTITLMALLVLLVVSLATLARVETRVAENGRGLACARQHALLSMNIALGQLQRFAGPDARITARAEITSPGEITNPYFTGVWDAAPGSGSNAITWLVSGGERPGVTAGDLLSSAPDPRDDAVGTETVFVVGNQSVAADPSAPTEDEKKRRIKLTKQDIASPPGAMSGVAAGTLTHIGRYAWWIGDEGVKASLVLPDRADKVTYSPWNTETQRRRIRQQIASTPNYFRAITAETAYAKEGFDPLAVGSALAKVASVAQLSFLPPAAGTMNDFRRGHYHDFTTTAYSVLANTRTDKHAGLLRDLSLKPGELGAAFEAYANYRTLMETPASVPIGMGGAVDAPESDGVDSPCRRYRITPPVMTGSTEVPQLSFGVAPTMTEMILQFSVEYASGGQFKVGTKIYVGLWNPYTAAFVPPSDLYLTISGLPRITVTNHALTRSATLDLQGELPAEIKDPATGAMRVSLPFVAGDQADRQSWLSGRVYGWTTKSSGDGVIDEVLRFYNKNAGSAGRWYYQSGILPGGSSGIGVTAPGVSALIVKLKNDQGTLATYTLPAFSGFSIPSLAPPGTKWFAYAVRLKQPWLASADRTWLKSFDPHDPAPPADAWTGFDPLIDFTPPLDPSLFMRHDPETALPESLLYRVQGTSTVALSSYNDVPLFELPRLPVLSLGELQHLNVCGKRAYFIGNSWGGEANAIFDRYFFSGLPITVSAAAGVPDLKTGQPLPNWNLRVFDITDVSAVRAAGDLSSRHLLQAGGFNINSTSVAAWRAVLSSVRLGRLFTTAGASGNKESGAAKTSNSTAGEHFDADTSLGTGTAAPLFLRFSQSAQETYSWKPVTSKSDDRRLFDTHSFRLGVRGSNDSSVPASAVDSSITLQRLATDQIEGMAIEIVRLIKVRSMVHGPFRTLEEFLGPQNGVGTPSLLETAIENARINPDEIRPLDTLLAPLPAGGYSAGYSSLTLTQGDVLTVLAPYLRARSDTFVIRSYGEALNSVSGEITGKAWLEAVVQRVPEVANTSDNIAQPTNLFGRRFKIISFRWLSPADI
jgi:hypothetical protein